MAKETVFILSAHSDDFVLGTGGTTVKYLNEGKNVVAIVFSYGESSHPWLKHNVTIEMRVKETEESCKVLGISDMHWLGLTEGKFEEELINKKAHDQIASWINKNNPSKIFTHSLDDPHPDHRAVYKETLKLIEEVDYKGDVYSFNIWNPVNIRKRTEPKLWVDISSSFWTKMKALSCFKSQKAALFQLFPLTMWNDFRNGITNKTRFAEVFIKIK